MGLDTATAAKRQLEVTARQANETCDRLTAANDVLSAKALSLAEDAEHERRTLTKKWTEEVDALRKRLEDAQEEADEGRTRGQAQRIQLLDEVGCSAIFAHLLIPSSTRCKQRTAISASRSEQLSASDRGN